MAADVRSEVARLLAEGKAPHQVRLELESKGFSSDDVAAALAQPDKTSEERKNSRSLAAREFFDRIGYGAAAPQFVNIIFWISQMGHPLILPLIGLLNGIKTLLSVLWSGILQEYGKLHRTSKNMIAAAGIIFGFSFLFMSFGILLQNTLGMVLFSISFLLGTIGVVAYGDLYQRFVHDTIRKERMGAVLRTVGVWGVIVTAMSMVLAGYLIDRFPLTGVPWTFTLLGKTLQLEVYGYLLAFEISAFAFIIAGYVSSLVIDKREAVKYSLRKFLSEHYHIMRGKLHVFSDKYVSLLLIATVISGFLQIIITSYSGIAIYQQLVAQQNAYPFLTLAIIYAIAIVAAVTGPFFTQLTHRSTGLAPMLVFGTLLMAILPLIIVYNPNIAAIAAALALYVIGGAILGFSQGLLAQRLMDEQMRRDYFYAQSFIIILPYLILIPLLALASYLLPLSTLFLIVAGGMIVIVMPIYFILVTIGQKVRL